MREEFLETYFHPKKILDADNKKFLFLQSNRLETFSNLVKWMYSKKPKNLTYNILIVKQRQKFQRKFNVITTC